MNQLLVEMDGFDTRKGVILMAATNRPEILDPALLRPGRFDRHILVDRPDIKGREEILKVHCKNVKLGKNVDIKIIAARTPGFVGADLANVVNEAALLAARVGNEAVGMDNFEEAINRGIAGLEKKKRVMSKKSRKLLLITNQVMPLLQNLCPAQIRYIGFPSFHVGLLHLGIRSNYLQKIGIC